MRIQRYHSYTDNLSLTNIFDNLNAAENQSFWLSVAGRLQNADGPWGQDVYGHDGVGNRTSFARTVSGVTTTRTSGYGGTNNLHYNVTIGAANDRVFNYDASGNQIADNRGATLGNFTYTINRAGRMASATRGGTLQGTYTYDAFERLRVRTVSNQAATANNGTTHYVWDIFGNIIAEANGTTGATLRETIYLQGGEMGAMPIAAVNAAVTPKLTYAVHVDHLNRPIMMTDSTKTNVWWAAYEPFGKVRATGGTLTQNLGLPGQWFQLENGLAYNWHRHYDPTTGRYTSADPLGFVDGPSVFAYAGNNPQSMVDPTGQFGLPGAALAGGVNWALQFGNNFFFRGRGFWDSLIWCIEPEPILASAAFGVISPGLISTAKGRGGPMGREMILLQAVHSAAAAALGFAITPFGSNR